MTSESAIHSILASWRRKRRPALALLIRMREIGGSGRARLQYYYLRNILGELAERSGGELVSPHPALQLVRVPLPFAEAAEHLEMLSALQREASGGASLQGSMESFELPREFERFRTAVQTAIAAVQGAAQAGEAGSHGSGGGAARAPFRGRLDMRKLARLESLLDGIELAPFLRRQRMVRMRPAGPQPVYTEIRIDRPLLQHTHYPALQIDEASPLKDALDHHLHRLLLIEMLAERPFARRATGFRFPLALVDTEEFARLDAIVGKETAARIVLQIDWLDWLRDLAAGEVRLRRLADAGYRLAVEGVPPAMLGTPLDAGSCRAEFLRLRAPDCGREQLLSLPASARSLVPRLALVDIDDPRTLELAARAGVRHFQGWIIERILAPEPENRRAAAPLSVSAA